MAELPYKASYKRRFFKNLWMVALQLLALSVVAFAVGFCSIRLYRQHISGSIEKDMNFAISRMEERASALQLHAGDDLSDDVEIQEILNEVSAHSEMTLFLVSDQSVCIACSKDVTLSASDITVPENALETIQTQGWYTATGSSQLDPAEMYPVITSGCALTLTDVEGEAFSYYLFTDMFSGVIDQFINKVFVVACIAVVLMLIVMSIVQVVRVRRRDRMENALARVLRSYAKSDFGETLDPDTINAPTMQEIVRSLNQVISNLKTVSEQQSQFTSNVSHELRTPMTIISGYVDGILDGTIPKARTTEYLYIVSQEMQRLKILISSMLNLTKFDNGTLQIQREMFTLNDLVFRTFLMFENRLEKKHITLEGMDCDAVRIYGDRNLISQVVYNLVENAVKFVDTGGTITIRMDETKAESIFAIRNTGTGISAEELPKIFGRFYKSDFSRSQDKTGLGLGLDIIRKILRLHEAQISVSSEENVFTEFVVSFPKKAQSETAE
jgi:signal transduction histidine kinase